MKFCCVRIEKHEATQKAWHTVADNYEGTNIKVTGLREGVNYFFNVRAINEFSPRLGCETKSAVKASEVPGMIDYINVTDITDNSVRLSSTKPMAVLTSLPI